MQKLKNKVALITGGTSGIGLATVTDLIEQGATVIITGRNEQTLKETVAQLGANAWGIVCDAGKMEDIQQLLEQVRAISPTLDVLFINAGYGKFAPVENVEEQTMDELFDVIVKGGFFTVQALLPLMRPGSSVIFNTSVVSLYGSKYASVYSAAKSAVGSFIQTFAAEYAENGIRINGVSPGYTETDGFNKTGMDKEQIEAVIGSVLPTLPFRRFAKASEIAKVVSFLASDDASYIHGTQIVVDGGFTAIR